MKTTTLTTFAVFLTLIALPATALAANVGLNGERLKVSASADVNELVIGRDGKQISVEEHGPDGGLTTSSSRCSREVDDKFIRVECPASGIEEIVVSTGGGNDWVVVGRDLPDSRGDRNNCSGSKIGVELDVDLGEGNDIAELGASDDRVRGQGGRDLLMACAGDDLVVGGRQNDDLSGDRGNDRLRGQGASDRLVGCSYDPDDVNYPRDENGDDDLDGGADDDFLFGCNGLDAFSAGGGNDDLNVRDGIAEVVDCGEGGDVVYLDPDDSRPGCETVTNCTTDNYPIGPDTGDPSCFAASKRT